MFKNWMVNYSKWDGWGIFLSIVCLIHCIVSPVILLSIPILARYYLMHPIVHYLLALIILPVGLVALVSGFRHHHHKIVMLFGLPGLIVISVVPILVHSLKWNLNEPFWMVLGSVSLVFAHYKNQKACRCQAHNHNKI